MANKEKSSEFKLFGFDDEIESNETIIDSKKIKVQTKIRMKNKLKNESASKIFDELPAPGESIHIVSNGKFDYFNLVPILIEMAGGKAKSFYFSTWTLSQNNAEKILRLFDDGSVGTMKALTGLYFKQREPQVFNYLYEGFKERNLTMACNENHSKVTLIEINRDFYIIEGSANFTANPRIEQFVVTNHKELYFFHKEWMDEIIGSAK